MSPGTMYSRSDTHVHKEPEDLSEGKNPVDNAMLVTTQSWGAC